MIRFASIVLACAALVAGCAASRLPEPAAAKSGIDTTAIDPAIPARTDFFEHANGRWLKATPFPPDRAFIGVATEVADATRFQLRAIAEQAVVAPTDAEDAKVGALYASFMDEATVERLGLAPLAPELARIDAVANARSFAALMPRLMRLGAAMPIALNVGQDDRDATRYVAGLTQSGLALPDRDYYLLQGDTRFAAARAAYLRYLTRLSVLMGASESAAAESARRVLELETALARVQWPAVDLRDPVKAYNPVAFDRLSALAPGIDWTAWLAGAGLGGAGLAEHAAAGPLEEPQAGPKVGSMPSAPLARALRMPVDSTDRSKLRPGTAKPTELLVGQPSYLTAFARLVESLPLATWKLYAKARLIDAYAAYLPPAFVEARFAFVGTALSGATENVPRWERGVRLVDTAIGDALARPYVARHFPPASKARMEVLVANLLAACRDSIENATWMGPETRVQALAKLATFNAKIGYPKHFTDYATLEIRPADLIGNVMRARLFEQDRRLAKLGQPIDRDEWDMRAQTVNAYYDPSMNEIVFPAAFLQAPFFDPAADDAVNYGAVGAVIGHEISHGFDDQGSQYDASGNLRNWWTAEDRARYDAKTAALVRQYSAFVALPPDHHVNGELTLGENIADNAGLALAWKAWQRSLGGKTAPVLGGLTGAERFFLGYAQSWRGKERDDALLALIRSNPHAPDRFRVIGTVRNQPDFYSTFDVRPGDGMYLPPEARVSIW